MAAILIKNGCSAQTITWQIDINGGAPRTGTLDAGDVLLKQLPPNTLGVRFLGFTGDAYVSGPAVDPPNALGVFAAFDTGVPPS